MKHFLANLTCFFWYPWTTSIDRFIWIDQSHWIFHIFLSYFIKFKSFVLFFSWHLRLKSIRKMNLGLTLTILFVGRECIGIVKRSLKMYLLKSIETFFSWLIDWFVFTNATKINWRSLGLFRVWNILFCFDIQIFDQSWTRFLSPSFCFWLIISWRGFWKVWILSFFFYLF